MAEQAQQFIVDEQGNQTGVLLDMTRYRALLQAQAEFEKIRRAQEEADRAVREANQQLKDAHERLRQAEEQHRRAEEQLREQLQDAHEDLEDARDHERAMADVRSGREERTLRRGRGE